MSQFNDDQRYPGPGFGSEEVGTQRFLSGAPGGGVYDATHLRSPLPGAGGFGQYPSRDAAYNPHSSTGAGAFGRYPSRDAGCHPLSSPPAGGVTVPPAGGAAVQKAASPVQIVHNKAAPVLQKSNESIPACPDATDGHIKTESARGPGGNPYSALPVEGDSPSDDEGHASPLEKVEETKVFASVEEWLRTSTRQQQARDKATSVAVYLVLAMYAAGDRAGKVMDMRTADKSEYLFSKVLRIDDTVEDDDTEASTTRLFDRTQLYWGPDNTVAPPVAKIKSFEQILKKEYPAHVLFLGTEDQQLAQRVLGKIGHDKRHNRLRLVISTFPLTFDREHWRRETVNDGNLACESDKTQFFCHTLLTYAGEEQVQSQQTTKWKRPSELSPTLKLSCNLNMPYTLQDLLASKAFSNYDADANRHCLKNGYLKLFVRTVFSILSGIDLLKRRNATKYAGRDAKTCLDDMVLVYLGAGQPNADPKRVHMQKVAELFQMRMILYDTNEMEFMTTHEMLQPGVEVRVKEPESTDWYGTINEHEDNGQGGNYFIKPIGTTDTKQIDITRLQLARIEYRKKMFTMAEANVLQRELEDAGKFGIVVSDIRSGISSAVMADELVQTELSKNHPVQVKQALEQLSQRLKDTMGDMAERDNIVQYEWYKKLSNSPSLLLYSAKYFNRHAVPEKPDVQTLLPTKGMNWLETFIPSTETNWVVENKKAKRIINSKCQLVKKWTLCKHKLLGGTKVQQPRNLVFQNDGKGFATSNGSWQPIGAYVVVKSRYYKPDNSESFADDITTVITTDFIFQPAPGGRADKYTRTNLIPHDKHITEVTMRKSRSDSTYFMEPTTDTNDEILLGNDGVYYRRVKTVEELEFKLFNASEIDNAMYNLHAKEDQNHTQENCIMIRAMLTLCNAHMEEISEKVCEIVNKEYNVAIHKYVDHRAQETDDDDALLILIKLEVGLLTWDNVDGDKLKARVWAYFSEVWKGWQRAVYLTAPSTWENYRPSITDLPGLPNKNVYDDAKKWYQSCIYWYSMWLHLLPKTEDLATTDPREFSEHLTGCRLFQNDGEKIMLYLGRGGLQSPGTWPIGKPVLYVAIELGILPLVGFLLSGTNCMTLLRTPLRRKGCTYNPLGYALYYNKTTGGTNTNFHEISMHILDRCAEHLRENVDDVRSVMAEENLMPGDERESVRFLAQDKPIVLAKINEIEAKIQQEIGAAVAQDAAESPPATASNPDAKDEGADADSASERDRAVPSTATQTKTAAEFPPANKSNSIVKD